MCVIQTLRSWSAIYTHWWIIPSHYQLAWETQNWEIIQDFQFTIRSFLCTSSWELIEPNGQDTHKNDERAKEQKHKTPALSFRLKKKIKFSLPHNSWGPQHALTWINEHWCSTSRCACYVQHSQLHQTDLLISTSSRRHVVCGCVWLYGFI